MEVEFLSNMRYTLLVSAKQWNAWLDKLSAFWEYTQLAQRSPSPTPSPLLIPSPTHRGFASPLPSPTGSVQLTPGMHPASQHVNKHSPAFGSYNGSNGAVAWPSNYPANNDISPLALRPESHFLARKRSFPEDDPSEPPAKRVGRPAAGPGPMQSHPQQQQQQPSSRVPPQYSAAAAQAQVVQQRIPSPVQSQPRPPPGLVPDQGRLAVPNLTLNTSHSAPHVTTQSYAQSVYAPPQASPLSLPPLVPGVRAMSTVYPVSTYTPQQAMTATAGPNIPSVSQAVTTPTTSFPPMSYGTPTKRLSPQHQLASSSNYVGSSPVVDPFGHHGSTSGLHTPIYHSPSVYLQQRNSPYKPVRQVNTLLIPPPSAFLHQYHFPNAVTPNQMHYQPLGRRNEYRTGIVPEYTMGGHPQAPPPGNQAPPSGYLPHPAQPRANFVPAMGRPEPTYRPQY